MSQTISLKELERKAWRSVFQDGLWDIYLGLLLLVMAIGTLLSDTSTSETQVIVVYLVLTLLAMLVLWAGKRFITVPRMGRVKFGPKGKARKKKARLVLAVSVIVGLVVFVISWLVVKGNWSEGLPWGFIFPAAWVVNALIVFGLGAYFLEFERLYLIGVMYALAVPLDFALKKLAGVDLSFFAFGLPAAVILLVGLIIFIRFLRDYPLPGIPAEGEVNGAP